MAQKEVVTINKSFIEELFERGNYDEPFFPDKKLAGEFIDRLFHFLFIPFKGKYDSKEELETEYENLKNSFSSLLFDLIPKEYTVKDHTRTFFFAIPGIYRLLLKDAAAIARYDPASVSVDEVFVAYPGFYATAVYRLAHQLYRQKVKVLPRLLSEHAHSRTGIDIHPGALIGESFFIDHGTGIVIGESTVIGDHVKIYQGVTLGALNVAKEDAKMKRHPTIENNVIIYSGATVLGGDTVIGHDSIIGGNVWLTNAVAPYSVVYQKSEVIVRDPKTGAEPIGFLI